MSAGRGRPLASVATAVLLASCGARGPDAATPSHVVTRAEAASHVPPAAPAPASAAFHFGETHSTEEIERSFDALARDYPRWMRAGSLGLSVEGRRIPCLTITDGAATAPKRGMWIDGAIHGHEPASAEPVLGVAECLRQALERGEPPALLERVVFHLVPVINVDARRMALEPPYVRQRLNLAPVDDDGDGALDEDPYADINGDGHALLMWTTPPFGSNQQYESFDQDGDGRCGEDPLGGVDLNRNFPVVRGAGDAPASPLQPETEAVVRFWLDHPEIELAVSFHTSAEGYVLPPVPLRAEDAPRFASIVAIYVAATGGGELSSATHSVLAPQHLRGITSDWFYGVRGATAITIEVDVGRPSFESFPRMKAEHEPFGQVEVIAIPPDSPLAKQSHLELPMEPEAVMRHADYLIKMAEALPLGH